MTSALDQLLNHWQNDKEFVDNVAIWKSDTARGGSYQNIPSQVNPGLKCALNDAGIISLYSHQLESWNAINEGKNPVIVTSTASGKTLCYNLPVLERLISNHQATALYLFPTKALSEDQQSKLSDLTDTIDDQGNPRFDIPVSIFDGDTPSSTRQMIRSRARIIITNPDMLHLAILPHHPLWSNLFQNLRFVIIDEIHAYRGLFGSHIANVIRRLKRIANYYGSNPQFVLTSATIDNPKQHAKNLIEENVELIQEDGSPRGPRQTIFYNPPIINPDLGIRQSAISEGVRLAEDLYSNNIQTLIFSRTRRAVELIIRRLLSNESIDRRLIHGYRSGYLASERRKIESDLRHGRVRIVVSTNALELGMDIGGVEAVILTGYPGTIASTRQQAGRAGRKNELSLAVLVASMSPIDQFLMRNPQYYFGRSAERALIDPNNFLLLLHHIRCAAFELPFDSKPTYGTLDKNLLLNFLQHLEMTGEIYRSNNSFRWVGENYPAAMVSLRNIDANVFQLLSTENDRSQSIGSIDGASVKWMAHPGAVYLHDGRTYVVDELNFDESIVRLSPEEIDYYTEPKQETRITLINTSRCKDSPPLTANFGEIEMTTRVIGYRKISWQTSQVLQTLPLELPETTFQTTSFWFTIQEAVVNKLRVQGMWSYSPNQYGFNWNKQRKAALSRDHYSCQNCGKTDLQTILLHVHHIIPFRQFVNHLDANQLNNLVTLCPDCHQRAESVLRIRSGMAGLRYSLHNLAAWMLMCDQTDIGAAADLKSIDGKDNPMILFYDGIPGGIGLSSTLYEIYPELLLNARQLIEQCSCTEGCPACVGTAGELGPGGKEETLTLLRELIHPNENV